MVQHSDNNPEFQEEVLGKMKIEVDKENTDPGNYGLLVDRVMLNKGGKQVYGTQVTYNMETGQAYAKSLEDSLNAALKRSDRDRYNWNISPISCCDTFQITKGRLCEAVKGQNMRLQPILKVSLKAYFFFFLPYHPRFSHGEYTPI